MAARLREQRKPVPAYLGAAFWLARVSVLDNIRRMIGAKSSVTLSRQFCFVQTTQRTVQSTFTGTDANGHAIV